LYERRCGGCGARKNEVGLERDEFLCESFHRLRVGRCRPASVNPGVAALRPPELLETVPKRGYFGLSFRVALRIAHQHADAPTADRLLRPRRARPRSRATEHRDELAPSHVLPSMRGWHPTIPRKEIRRCAPR